MTLPTSRNRTYAPHSQLFSADLNDLQDKIIALNNLITATAQAVWTGITLAANQSFTVSGTGKYKRGTFRRPMLPTFTASTGSWTWSIGPLYQVQSGGSATALITLPVEVGDRITDLEINVSGDGAADCTFTAAILGSGQAKTDLCSGTDSNRSSSWATLALSSLGTFTPHTMVAGESLALIVAPNASGYTLGNCAPVLDVP
jgi:hypothetical protein